MPSFTLILFLGHIEDKLGSQKGQFLTDYSADVQTVSEHDIGQNKKK